MNYIDKFKNLAHRSGLKLSEVKKIALERTAEFLNVPLQKIEEEPCTSFSQRVELCHRELLRQLEDCRIVVKGDRMSGITAKEVAKLADIKFSTKVVVAALHKVFESRKNRIKFDEFYHVQNGGLTFKIAPNYDESGIFFASDSFDYYPCMRSSISYEKYLQTMSECFYNIIKKAVEAKILCFNSSEQERVMEYAHEHMRSDLSRYSIYLCTASDCANAAVYPLLAFSFAADRYCRQNNIDYKESDLDIICGIKLLAPAEAFSKLVASAIDELTASTAENSSSSDNNSSPTA